jgi:hypothetical protein
MADYHRWYRAGTISVVNGATVATGLLTAWLANARPGDEISFDGGGKWYEVASVEDNTSLTLGSAFGETTVSGGAYAIGRSGPAWSQVADVAVQFAALIDSQTDIFSGDGAPSDELGADGSAYFQQTPPTFYLKSGGTWGSGVSIVGGQGPAGPGFAATSSTSLSIGTGSKALTVGTGLAYAAGARARAYATSDATKWMEGLVTSYTGGVLTINVDKTNGSGTISNWTINVAGEPGAKGDKGDTGTKGDTGNTGATGAAPYGTSATSRGIGTGSMVFTTQTGLAFGPGTRVRCASAAAPTTKWMEGPVSDYTGTALTVAVDTSAGSGSAADWIITIAGERGQQGIQGVKGDTGLTGPTGPNAGLDYAWDASSEDSDPGNGEVRVNNTTWASASWIYISKTGRNAETLATVINNLFALSNAHRAHVRLFPVANRTIYFEADVVGSLVDGTTYWKIPVTNVVASVSQPSAAALMAVVIDRTGEGALVSNIATIHALMGGI